MVAQIIVSPFLLSGFPDGFARVIVALTVFVFSQLWAMEVSENKARQSSTNQFQDSHCTWVQIPRLPNGQLPTVMRISVHGGNPEHGTNPPVLLAGAVVGDAGFVAYIEDVLRSQKQILEN